MITLDSAQVLVVEGYASSGVVTLKGKTVSLFKGDRGILTAWGWVRLV